MDAPMGLEQIKEIDTDGLKTDSPMDAPISSEQIKEIDTGGLKPDSPIDDPIGLEQIKEIDTGGLKIDSLMDAPMGLEQIKEIDTGGLKTDSPIDDPMGLEQIKKIDTGGLKTDSPIDDPMDLEQIKEIDAVGLKPDSPMDAPMGLEQIKEIDTGGLKTDSLMDAPMSSEQMKEIDTGGLKTDSPIDDPMGLEQIKEIDAVGLKPDSLMDAPMGLEQIKEIDTDGLKPDSLIDAPMGLEQIKEIDTGGLKTDSPMDAPMTSEQIKEIDTGGLKTDSPIDDPIGLEQIKEIDTGGLKTDSPIDDPMDLEQIKEIDAVGLKPDSPMDAPMGLEQIKEIDTGGLKTDSLMDAPMGLEQIKEIDTGGLKTDSPMDAPMGLEQIKEIDAVGLKPDSPMDAPMSSEQIKEIDTGGLKTDSPMDAPMDLEQIKEIDAVGLKPDSPMDAPMGLEQIKEIDTSGLKTDSLMDAPMSSEQMKEIDTGGLKTDSLMDAPISSEQIKEIDTGGLNSISDESSSSTKFFQWSRIRSFFRNLFSRREEQEKWQEDLRMAARYCTSMSLNPRITCKLKRDGFKILERLIIRLNKRQLQSLDCKLLVWSSLSCIFYYESHLVGMGILECTRRKQFSRAELIYGRLLKKLLPQEPKSVIENIFSFITEYQMWSMEHLCSHVIHLGLELDVPGEMVLDQMLDTLDHYNELSVEVSRQVVRVMYELMKDYSWSNLNSVSIPVLSRLLSMYYQGMKDNKNHYRHVFMGLEVCTKRILDNMTQKDILLLLPQMISWMFVQDLKEDALLSFGNVLEYAIMIHKIHIYDSGITNELFKELLKMVASDNRLVSHFGNRVLHQLLDRHNNRHEFETPKIFFQNVHYNLTLGDCKSDDKYFLKYHREDIHDSLKKAFLHHGHNRMNLDCTYTSICLIIVEVPCGHTAASMVCLAMNIQEIISRSLKHFVPFAYHAQATIMAVMSLICWVHKASDFYGYINQIMNLRADQAPHLNPPLKFNYTFAKHHILWDKADLFFNDWEVRYGLWKCFKLSEGRQYRARQKLTEIDSSKSFTEVTEEKSSEIIEDFKMEMQFEESM